MQLEELFWLHMTPKTDSFLLLSHTHTHTYTTPSPRSGTTVTGYVQQTATTYERPVIPNPVTEGLNWGLTTGCSTCYIPQVYEATAVDSTHFAQFLNNM
jgi:hypothetical protein